MLTAVFAHQAAAAVGVRTCWPWETAATLPSARRRKARRRPRGRRVAWHTVAAARLQLVRNAFFCCSRFDVKIDDISKLSSADIFSKHCQNEVNSELLILTSVF